MFVICGDEDQQGHLFRSDSAHNVKAARIGQVDIEQD